MSRRMEKCWNWSASWRGKRSRRRSRKRRGGPCLTERKRNTKSRTAGRKAFYENYERKGELQHQTHYCPGCGHGIVHKMLARAIDELGIQDRTILISPVGCSVFAYYYFDVGNVQAAHGRAPAVATAVKRSRPQSIVVSYQGDGDLSAIGSAEILHAANRGENITVIFVNNAIYSMTGGQAAPTTLLGQKSTTTPAGRSAANEGYPLHVSELLATLEAPVYIERVGLGDNKQIAQAQRAIRRAVENQVRGLGFSLVEVLSPCPTIWKMSPVEAQHWVRDVMEKTYPLGVSSRSHEGGAAAGTRRSRRRRSRRFRRFSALPTRSEPERERRRQAQRRDVDLHVRVAGFGGQGVLLLGEVLAEADWTRDSKFVAALLRAGDALGHLELPRAPVAGAHRFAAGRPSPNVLVAMNEPSLHKFVPACGPADGSSTTARRFPQECEREDVHVLALPVHACRRRTGRCARGQHGDAGRAARDHRRRCRRPASTPRCAGW